MTRYRLAEGVLRADLEGEEVLLNPDTGMYHLLNATGRRLLAHMEADGSMEDAIQDLAEETGEPAERIRTDALEFVEEMLGRHLIGVIES